MSCCARLVEISRPRLEIDLYCDMVYVESFTATLAELTGNGPALELESGIGRIALPMRDKGVEAHGIDASEAMVARLRAK